MPIPQNRWLFSKWTYEELQGKTVFATFGRQNGITYDGKGEIRVLKNPEGLLKVELVFTNLKAPGVCEDIIFLLSPRQFPNLEEGQEGEQFDFYYRGTLTPDNDPS